MKIYNTHCMVAPEHIIVINKELEKIGSKVENSESRYFLDGHEHLLENVLSLALGSGSFGNVPKSKINKIGNNDFQIAI